MSAVLPSTLVPPGAWRGALLSLAVLWAVLGLAYADTASAMVGIWMTSETFAHAILVPPIAAWLVWRQRAELAAQRPVPEPWVLLALLPVGVLWLLGDLVVVNAATQLAFVSMLVLCVPAVLGWRVTHVILFPLLFLFFAVPIGDFMLDPMMDWTADFTVWALRASGIPVYREGLNFVIPSGHWSVVEACSGTRYLIASFMVGTLFAYLNYSSWRRRLIFIGVSIAVPIVANWLRAYGIVMLGHYSNNTLAVGVDHLIYGWVFFGVVVLIMFMIGARFSEPAGAPPVPAPGWVQRIGRWLGARDDRRRTAAPAVAVALAAMLLAPHGVIMALERAEQGAAAPTLALPAAWASGWRQAEDPSGFKPIFLAPRVELQSGYVSPEGVRVDLLLAYYRGQNSDSKLVTSSNILVSSDNLDWNRVSRGATVQRGLPLAGGADVPWRTARILGRDLPGQPRSQLTAWQVYWVNGQWVAGDARAKLVGALLRLRGLGDDGAALVLWADAPRPEQAEAALQAFTRDNLAELERLLQQTRDRR